MVSMLLVPIITKCDIHKIGHSNFSWLPCLSDKVPAVIPVCLNKSTLSMIQNDKSIGMRMPELTVKDLDSKDVSLSDYKGKVVLVNFWATWCIPCREEIPWLIEMQQMYNAKGFTVIGLAMDEGGRSVVAPFVAKERFDVNGRQLPMSYPILIGNDAATEKFGGLSGYPSSVLISRDGKQIQHVTGLISYEEITKAIKSQL